MSEEATYKVNQRVLVKSRMYGMREAIVRDLRYTEDGDLTYIVDIDPPAKGGGSMGVRLQPSQIVGPVVRKVG